MKNAIRLIKKLLLFILGLTRSLFSKKKYKIKAGYIHRRQYKYYDDTQLKDEHQKEVYEIAKSFMISNNYNKIIDMGCGSGYKLLTYFKSFHTVGIDVSPTYEFLTRQYPNREWINAEYLNTLHLETDIIICADVIEHVLNPDKLLGSLQKIDFKVLFLSTPERNISRGYFDYGPPLNEHHVREWTGLEFREYVSGFFEIVSHQITNFEQSTQLLICKKYTK